METPSAKLDDQGDGQYIAKAVVIGISLTFGFILLFITAFFVITFYRNKISKANTIRDQNSSTNSRERRNRNRHRICLEPYCKFVTDPNSLIVVRKAAELAFPGFTYCSVQTAEPLPIQLVAFYFEIEILTLENNVNLCIGFASSSLSPTLMPGHSRNSVGYCSLDGQVYINGTLSHYSSELKYNQGDIVGCGYFPKNQTLIITRNGERKLMFKFNIEIKDPSHYDLVPTVGSSGTSIVKANFGQQKFIYKEANRNGWGIGASNAFDTNDLVFPPPSYELSKESAHIEEGSSQSTVIVYDQTLSTSTMTRRLSLTHNELPPGY